MCSKCGGFISFLGNLGKLVLCRCLNCNHEMMFSSAKDADRSMMTGLHD